MFQKMFVMERLTERQKKVFEYLKLQIKLKGYAPSVREVCKALNIKSTSTVYNDFNALHEYGLIRKDPATPRALVITEHTEDEDTHSNLTEHMPDVVEVPLVGDIAAGQPILAEQHLRDSFPLPARFVNGNTNFMLQVHGDSMIEVGIFDNDYILVEERHTANNGDIVVAMIDDIVASATVKTFYQENGHFRLQPENSTMEPIIVDKVDILGIVKGVFRYF